jgi:hypothetical protein
VAAESDSGGNEERLEDTQRGLKGSFPYDD